MKTKNIATLFFLFTFMLLSATSGFSQNDEEARLYDASKDESAKGNYQGAVDTLDKLIKEYPQSKAIPGLYVERAVLNIRMNKEEEALKDFTTAYKKDSTLAEAVGLRGNLKYKMNKPDEAIADYQLSLRIDSNYTASYARLALVYKKQSKIPEACTCFEKALAKGETSIARGFLAICDTNTAVVQKYLLHSLTEVSADPEYGFTEKKPIRIGSPVTRQKIYLSLLRDSKGRPVKFEREGSCCEYSSKNGLFGIALIDVYKVKLDGKKKLLYITFYDYEDPKIPMGFHSAQEFGK